MFNFIINGTCSKGCSFCFTEDDVRLQNSLGEMTLEYVNKLLDYYEFDSKKGSIESNVRIVGGEPTQHSNFIGIIDTIIKRGLRINLVSNFLWGDYIRDYLVENIRSFNWMLPNSAELDEKNRLKLWKKNYLSIYEAYENSWGFEEVCDREGENICTCGLKLYLSITISRDYKERNHFEYIKWLCSQIPNKVKAIRIGLDLTGTYLLNDKELGKELIKISKFGEVNNILVSSDCQIPPCLWEGDTQEVIMMNSNQLATFNNRKTDLTCGNLPIDVFPDGTSSNCYPLKGAVNVDVFDVDGSNKIKTLEKIYNKKYVANYIKYDLPDDCLNCVFYLAGCNGICGGCLHGEVMKKDFKYE